MSMINEVKPLNQAHPTQTMNSGQTVLAKPLHLQRLEAALNMAPFMKYAQNLITKPLSSSEEESEDSDNNDLAPGDRIQNGILTTRKERFDDKFYIYNLSQIGSQRKWLQDILLSDTETESEISDEDGYIRCMLKDHIKERKIRAKYYRNANNSQYGYFGAGLLSNYDMFTEHQRSITGLKKRKRTKKADKLKKLKTKIKTEMFNIKDESSMMKNLSDCPGNSNNNDLEFEDHSSLIKDELDDEYDSKPQSPIGGVPGKRSRKNKLAAKTPEVMAARRRKVWQLMAKKELGKIQRAKANNHKEILTNCKKVAVLCMKISRQKAMQSQKNMKETIWRAKRLTREMQGYWKRYDRVERETRRRMEKEAEEQRKMDVELVEAKRQQRKLNFLITQTELYAHFMSKKLGNGTEEEQLRILNQLDEEINPRLAAIDDYDSELMKQIAQKNASDAFNTERARTRLFDVSSGASCDFLNLEVDQPQPDLFQGSLKGYQIKGMTWLANLYDQGISGILADEMGLGKTVQSIAFLCHIAEKYGVWGPFLIISPASTLHNWQQEMARFVPDFRVVPYWGSPNERKILRQFWEQKDLHTREASFHVVITSYQLVVSDYKYFNRIKWQYMILDEAQAIKSSTSVRWKLLLGFNCRNRLLLSGTPIQNSMAELWALLHFIMPTLFDSHDEFNEWFSKDIESHAENKTGIDEKQISRLHMILKPFMLRRIKKDVENELSDKIEVMVYCPLTTRQKLLYVALKKKIRIEDLLHYTVGGGDGHSVDKNFTSNLMNLVMQFRKVCNHPELFERRDAKSPFYMKCTEYVMPRLIFDECLLYRQIPSKRHLLYNKFSIFKSHNINLSLMTSAAGYYTDLNLSTFSFSRFTNLSPHELENLTLGNLIYFLRHVRSAEAYLEVLNLRRLWSASDVPRNANNRFLLLEPTCEQKLNRNYMKFSETYLSDFLFCSLDSRENALYSFASHKLYSMAETMEHRIIRSKNYRSSGSSNPIISSHDMDDSNLDVTIEDDINQEMMIQQYKPGKPSAKTSYMSYSNANVLPEFTYIPRPPRPQTCQPTSLPTFLYGIGPKVQCNARKLYCDSRAAQWAAIRHEECENFEGRQIVLSGLEKTKPKYGWSNIIIPDKQTLVSDAGKLFVLDNLLSRLKQQGHRVLIYSQMTKMIDLLEEYMWHRKHRYMRLDGSSKISARRDMVADFQNRADIFVFLLSTRAGGLGINLTAADTVIFYDSDWNPTVDQQAMDRAHRLGQTKQVTVYRLICKGTIEERILQRAREKSEIQRMVISGGNFKPDTLKPKEVVSLLLDDEEIELKYKQKTEERKSLDDNFIKLDKEKDRKRKLNPGPVKDAKRVKLEGNQILDADDLAFLESGAPSPAHSDNSRGSGGKNDTPGLDESSNEALVVDCDSPSGSNTPVPFYDGLKPRRRHHPRGTKRGRPRGSRRGGGSGSLGRSETSHNVGDLVSAQTSQSSASGGSNSSAPAELIAASLQTVAALASVKRGPGRPRLKPSGPVNKGFRGAPRPRKPIGPLVVPLGQSPAQTPTIRSPALSPAPSPASEKGLGFYQQIEDDT